MNIMGNGLSKMAGGKLETILEKLTKKEIKNKNNNYRKPGNNLA
ncbi:MAG: hypothetical protein IJ232_00200 [Lachnospiraceae bacterium]|nr:hypothetical protein [Lachnospiraceae bacterium]